MPAVAAGAAAVCVVGDGASVSFDAAPAVDLPTGAARVAHKMCNIRDHDSVRELMDFAAEAHGGIDFLVNNAGGQFPSPAAKINRKDKSVTNQSRKS